jgi:hypothetical protein
MSLGLSLGLSLRSSALAGFSPLSLFAAGEQGYWLDASDFSTMFQDDAGTTPVTAVGQSVGRWLDKSGRGNHFIQSNVANRPILQVDSGGRHFLLFDGSDDFIQSAANIDPGAVDKLQVFAGVRKLVQQIGIVVETSTSSLDAGAWGFSDGSGSGGGSRTFGFRSQDAFVASSPEVLAPTTYVGTAIADRGAPNITLRRNGTQVAINSDSQGTGNYLTYPHFIGRRAGTALPFSGRIYQLITRFGPNLSADQIAAAEAFVNQKTGAF